MIFFLYFIFLNFYFNLFSNNKFKTSYLFEKNNTVNNLFFFNQKKINEINNEITKNIPTFDISNKKFQEKMLNQFLTEGFLCLQENNLFIDEYEKKSVSFDKNLIKSLSLQGGYFYNRKYIDKILIKFNHSKNSRQADRSFIDYLNYCFNRSFQANNIIQSYLNFLETEILKYDKFNLLTEIDQLRLEKIQDLDFKYLVKKHKSTFNYYYYLSLICFGFALSLILNTIFSNFFDRKKK